MKKGFTLIELLAVIVILAIIALIAVPIVVDIIKDSKESAIISSSELYLKATENAVANKMLKDPMFKMEDGMYSIMDDGNICLGTYSDNSCTGDVLKVESDKQRPNGGSITIKDGQIVNHSIAFGDKIIKSDDILLSSIKYNQKYRQISVGPNGEGSIWYFEFYEDGSANNTYI